MNCQSSDKVAAPLPKLSGVLLTGFENKIDVEWSTLDSYPNQSVRIIFRKNDNTDIFRESPTNYRDVGKISTLADLEPSIYYTIWIRPETATYYGEWQAYLAVTDPGWISGIEAVIHNGELVYFGDELVTVIKT